VPEISVKDQLKKLIELQKIDSEIYSLSGDLKEKPLIIEELKSQFEESKGRLNELENNLKELQVNRKAHELDLKAKEDDITKANAVLMTLKTNKEYTALQSEINNLKADNSVLEEEILKFLEEGQAHKTKVDEANAALQKAEAEFKEKEAVLLSEKQTCETEVAKCKIQKSELVKSVEPEILSMYERILEKRHGIALVPAVDGSCSACGMLLRAQTLDQLHMEDQTVVCEKCSRILYLQEA